MTSDGVNWTATVPVPWDTAVQYKFRVDGSDAWVVDPNNPDSVDDGFGGKNSLLEPTTCEEFSCDSALIGTFDWRDSVIYFVFVDRFENGNKGNDKLIGVEAAADWYGGDWAGVQAKVEEGYFNELGVNTLWLTVPMDNTDDKGIGTDGHFYSVPRILADQPRSDGGALRHAAGAQGPGDGGARARPEGDPRLRDEPRARGSPVYSEHKDWFWPNDNGKGGDCVCGSGCSWDDAVQARRCWFTDYLPDFNFENAAARKFSIDNAVQWIKDTGHRRVSPRRGQAHRRSVAVRHPRAGEGGDRADDDGALLHGRRDLHRASRKRSSTTCGPTCSTVSSTSRCACRWRRAC
jgi:hypothetical protein